ncbi:MAG: alpha/beta hydrolase [Anaerolineales bacterium]|nr:alpha/beta hydrolase [Anaerolineales bacterium]
MSLIQTAGLQTYYDLTGSGEETLVFIHGLGSSSRDWEYQVPFFAEYYQVLTYDVRGHGRSGKPAGPYSVAMFAADLANLLKKLKIGSAHLAGLSMGGWIAFQFGVDFPQMTRSLTIVNSWADMRPKNFADRRMLFKRNILFRLFSMRKIGETLAPKLFIKPEQEALRQKFIENWAKNHKPSYMASMKAGTGWSVADRLNEITCPVLVVSADEDYTPVAAKQAYVNALTDARLEVIEDSRHATPVERPQALNSVLLDFLQGL